MKKTKLLLSGICALALALTFSAPAKADAKADASKYLFASLVNGQYLDGFTPGTPDFGFSLEALLQLSQFSNVSGQLGAAKNYLLKDTRIIGKSGSAGYAFDSNTKKLNPAAAAKFAFVSAVVHAKNQDLRNAIVSQLADGKKNQLSSTNGSTFAYSWSILALEANHREVAANSIGKSLLKLQRKDGGFAIDKTADNPDSSTDATGIALQALAALKSGGYSAVKPLTAAVSRAVKYLNKTKLTDHWEAWGDLDVNGTAYALMGLKSVGKNVGFGIQWLKNQVSKVDGGIMTPWSNGLGDRFATAQSLLILKNRSYADLIRN